MKSKLWSLLLVVTGSIWWGVILSADAAPTMVPPVPAAQHTTISGPYNTGNMSVYMIHGKDQVKSGQIITLQEALAKQQVTVYETGDVNQLAVENKSNYIVFIQSGDIVKGGRQDRTMQYDMLLPPKSGRIPLPAFCVEEHRWTGRGGEASDKFGSSNYQVSGKAMKASIQGATKALPPELQGATNASIGPQGYVWDSVARQQSKLSAGAGGSVAAAASPSSMELTLENPRVKEATTAHVNALNKLVNDQKDAIGYAVAINGKITGADVYASHELFTKLWTKLLNSSAAEAVAQTQAGKQDAPPPTTKVRDFMSNADHCQAKPKVANKISAMSEQESSDAYAYKTRWNNAPRNLQIIDENAAIHSNYLSK